MIPPSTPPHHIFRYLLFPFHRRSLRILLMEPSDRKTDAKGKKAKASASLSPSSSPAGPDLSSLHPLLPRLHFLSLPGPAHVSIHSSSSINDRLMGDMSFGSTDLWWMRGRAGVRREHGRKSCSPPVYPQTAAILTILTYERIEQLAEAVARDSCHKLQVLEVGGLIPLTSQAHVLVWPLCVMPWDAALAPTSPTSACGLMRMQATNSTESR